MKEVYVNEIREIIRGLDFFINRVKNKTFCICYMQECGDYFQNLLSHGGA